MNHNVLQHKRLLHVLGFQLSSRRSSKNLSIGNVRCNVRLSLCSYHLILFEQSILSLLLQIRLQSQLVLCCTPSQDSISDQRENSAQDYENPGRKKISVSSTDS